ncbi:uncharacterized protein LOC117192266 [Drosophila miranda]|uniref:uncharacterized protein LOC117192266 n=1 Tax=Drosophila miranda TaxID=7229 RepID=UPI00143F73A9|nr:uncharacterized protein LOC117192266 [Drosophila miranda]
MCVICKPIENQVDFTFVQGSVTMTPELESESIYAKQATRSGHCKLEVWKLSSGTRIRIRVRKENKYWASMEPKQETLKKPDSGQLKHIRQQILLANVQELIKKMTHRCFRICIVRPGPTLTTSERDCISNCADLFMKSVQRVSQQYFRRRQWQQQRRLANGTAPAASGTASAAASADNVAYSIPLSDNKKV